MSVFLGNSRYFIWNCAVNANLGMVFFLPLDLKLELGPSVSTIGDCAVWTLGGGTGNSGRIICGTEGDMWTLCWKLVEQFPSSYSIILGCTEVRGLVIFGRTFWGIMADFSLVAVVEGLIFSENYLPPWKIYLVVAQLRPFGSRRCWEMALGVLVSSSHGLIRAPRWWHFLRKNCRGVEYCVGKFNAIWVPLSSCFGDIYGMAPILVHWDTDI